jgi:hypothetical protein
MRSEKGEHVEIEIAEREREGERVMGFVSCST